MDKETKHAIWWQSLKDAIKNAVGTEPTVVHGMDDYRFSLYQEEFRRVVKSIIDVKCSNNTWDIDYFKDTLLFDGRIVILDTSAGVIPQECGVFGRNAFYRENTYRVTNPILGSYEGTINVDGAMIYLMDNKQYWSFSTLVDVFAAKMASCDSAIDMNLINSKIAFVFNCEDKKQADEAKMLYDKVQRGDPAVFWSSDKSMSKQMEVFMPNAKQNFIAAELQTQKLAMKNEFLTKIGVNNMNIEKKERLLYDEVNGNNDEIECEMGYIEECIKRGVKVANKLFPDLNLEITFPYLEKMREDADLGQTQKQGMLNRGGNNDASKPD